MVCSTLIGTSCSGILMASRRSVACTLCGSPSRQSCRRWGVVSYASHPVSENWAFTSTSKRSVVSRNPVRTTLRMACIRHYVSTSTRPSLSANWIASIRHYVSSSTKVSYWRAGVCTRYCFSTTRFCRRRTVLYLYATLREPDSVHTALRLDVDRTVACEKSNGVHTTSNGRSVSRNPMTLMD